MAVAYGNISEDAIDRARKIELLILDCDGVLTDGSIIPLPNGDETKLFNSKDGHGLRMAIRAGLRVAIISGRESFAVRARAKDLGITRIYEGIRHKLQTYEAVLEDEKLRDEQVCFVGDDLPDLPLIRRAGLAVAVSDAVEEIKQAAHFTTDRPGGRGAVRQVIELILRAQEKWEDAIRRYRV